MVAIVPSRGERSTGKEVNKDIRVATLDVGTMRGRSNEVVEILIDICCVQESRWRGVRTLEKLQGKVLTAGFSGKRMILVVEE